jgi:hypothetical protein
MLDSLCIADDVILPEFKKNNDQNLLDSGHCFIYSVFDLNR